MTDIDREAKERAIIKVKEAFEDANVGDLFMNEDGDCFDNIDEATSEAEPGEVVVLTRFVQVPPIYVAVNEDELTPCLTEEKAMEAIDDAED